MLENNLPWVALAVVAVLALLLILALSMRQPAGSRQARGGHGKRRPHRDQFRATEVERPKNRAAIIVNPTKFDDLSSVKRQIAGVCQRIDWAEPLFIETTVDDPGTGQAREAVEQGVQVVCPLGGDGTVRAVAAGLAGTETPLGLLPGGTGNLLARNLSLPIDSLEDALRVALTGRNRRIDVGRLAVVETPDGQPTDDDIRPAPEAEQPSEEKPPTEHVFLVMAGIGFDANVMADAPEDLKNTVGWPAYVVSAAKHLGGDRFRVQLSIDGGESLSRRTQSVLFGNVGELTGGVQLIPEAKVDDGTLDCVVVSPKGLIGWAAVSAHVVTRQRRGHKRLEHFTGAEFSLESESDQEVQIDGDTIGKARRLRAWVEPKSLTVRVGS
ncbi:MAG: diacylglycerol kinase family lipid kinase [Micrococcales bacterium]|nr:diacylglycerol kinase family lipid kinase [Micrococcales bacterium]